jgi:hypothetical protein
MRYLIFIYAILVIACKKEDTGSKFFHSECMQDFKMPYTEVAAAGSYVEAQTSDLGPLRLVSGHEGDTVSVTIWQTVATTGPTLVLNGNYPVSKLVFMVGSSNINTPNHYSDNTNKVKFNIEKYSKKQFPTLESQIDSSIHIGKLLLNKNRLTPDTTKSIEDNGLSSIPEQSGTLECTAFSKEMEGNKIHYKISLKFDNITLRAGADFIMEDGKMVLDFKIPR